MWERIFRSAGGPCGCAKLGGSCTCAPAQARPQAQPAARSGSLASPNSASAGRHGFAFANITLDVPRLPAPLFDGKPAKDKGSQSGKGDKAGGAKGASTPQDCYDKCGGGELGSFECKLGPDGMPTADVDVTIREKDACLAPCVKVHEQRHARDLVPICREVASCLKQARADERKQNACLDAYEKRMSGRKGGSECAAYQAELECLAKRAGAPECRSNPQLAKHVARTRCYHDCFCA